MQIGSWADLRRVKGEYGQDTMFPYSLEDYKNHFSSTIRIKSEYTSSTDRYPQKIDASVRSGVLLADDISVLSSFNGNCEYANKAVPNDEEGHWLNPDDIDQIQAVEKRRKLKKSW